MIIDLDTQTPQQAYFSLIQTVIPRPIAWVLSENGPGDYNLAPFSYFNAVCSEPPLLMISIGKKPDGTFKDTKINIEERSRFVIHLVDEDTLEAMNQSAASLPHGTSELTTAGLQTTEFEGFSLPRLSLARVAFACSRYQIMQVGETPQSLVFGRVHRIHVDDDAVSVDARGRTRILADKIRPVGRMGPSEYVTFGDIIRKQRPA